MIKLLRLSVHIVSWLVISCGQDPAFLQLEGERSRVASGTVSGAGADDNSLDATGSDDFGSEDTLDNSTGDFGDEGTGGFGDDLDGDGWPDEIDGDDGVSNGGGNNGGGNNGGGNNGGGNNGGGNNGGGNNGGGNNGGGTGPNDIFVPDADVDDLDDIARCLALWGNNSPFGQTITNYEKIYASVSIGGSSAPINDTARTEDPKLILVVAGVAVNSNVTYNMLNPNGYYCIKVGVNVGTNLTANIHCNAHVAETSVAVNVGSSGDPLASIGVNVNSNTQVNIIRPADDQCRL